MQFFYMRSKEIFVPITRGKADFFIPLIYIIFIEAKDQTKKEKQKDIA